MSYKVYLFDALSPIEWSQVAWKLEGSTVATEDCRIEFLHDVMLQALPRDGLILDAGCGVARWPIYLRRLGYRVLGLEWSQQACGIARAHDPGLGIARGDVRHKPIRDGALDAVISLGVVEHDEAGPDAGLAEARRVLKPGGILVLAVPFNNLWRRLFGNALLDAVTARRRRRGWQMGFAEYRFSRREMRDALARAGFTVVSEHPNDLRPPRNMGLWVDVSNLRLDPFKTTAPEDLFIFRGAAGRLAALLTRWVPWWVAGEVILVARASDPRPPTP